MTVIPLKVEDMEPLDVDVCDPDVSLVQIFTQQQLEFYWPYCVDHMDRCVDKAMQGEFTTRDIHQMISEGSASFFIFTNNPNADPYIDTHVELCFVVQAVLYPRFKAVNILALGGRNLSKQRKLWEYFKGWAYVSGAKAIEASVSPAMARVLRSWDFEPVYTQVRCDLTEKENGR